MLYYNTKTKKFEWQKTKTTSAAKILLTVDILEENKSGTYGPEGLAGQYYSTIDGEDFLWDNLQECLIDPQYDVRILNPANYGDVAFIDR